MKVARLRALLAEMPQDADVFVDAGGVREVGDVAEEDYGVVLIAEDADDS